MSKEVFGKLLKQSEESNIEAQKKEWMEINAKVISQIFKEARAYTNIIMLGGFAGYFTMWIALGPLLTPLFNLILVLLFVISLASFVLFEIYKTHLFTIKIDLPNKYLKNANTYEEMIEGIKKYQNEKINFEFDQRKYWAFSFYTSVISGVLGVFIMLYFLITNLISEIG